MTGPRVQSEFGLVRQMRFSDTAAYRGSSGCFDDAPSCPGDCSDAPWVQFWPRLCIQQLPPGTEAIWGWAAISVDAGPRV